MVRLVTQAVLNVGDGMLSVAYVNLMKNGHDETPQAHVLCRDCPPLYLIFGIFNSLLILLRQQRQTGAVSIDVSADAPKRAECTIANAASPALTTETPRIASFVRWPKRATVQSAASGALRARLGDATGDDRTIGGIRGIKASRLERGSIRLSKILTNWPAAGAHLQQRAFYIHLPAALMQQPTPPCSP